MQKRICGGGAHIKAGSCWRSDVENMTSERPCRSQLDYGATTFGPRQLPHSRHLQLRHIYAMMAGRCPRNIPSTAGCEWYYIEYGMLARELGLMKLARYSAGMQLN